MPKDDVKKLRALTAMGLRRSADPSHPQYAEWHEWKAGAVFVPPKNLDVNKALKRRIAEEVK